MNRELEKGERDNGGMVIGVWRLKELVLNEGLRLLKNCKGWELMMSTVAA